MQYDMARFEQPLVDETQPKAHMWTDIGDVEVEHSVFGKAKVRVYRKRDEVRGALRWTLMTISVVVGAVWLIHDITRQPEIVYVAPPSPVVTPEPQMPVRAAPHIKPRVLPPVVVHNPVPQMQANSAPVAAKPLAGQPAVVSGASSPAVANPAPVLAKPALVAVPVAAKPVAPVVPNASKPVVPLAPAVASSAVPATN